MLPALTRKVHARQLSFQSVMPVARNQIQYSFSGMVNGASMSGTVVLGEYGQETSQLIFSHCAMLDVGLWVWRGF
jgi:hypothetical protein